MAKGENHFYCNECGTRYPKWLGKCESCRQWNTIVEDTRVAGKLGKAASSEDVSELHFVQLSDFADKLDRKFSHNSEFDRVLGGGAVPGSVVLIGGEPGIGKSTLLLQISAALSKNHSCVYISGEESSEQICLRATRLGAEHSNVKLVCKTNIDAVVELLGNDVDFLIIDSIQTLQTSSVESIPGSVTQVKACTYSLINFAKTTGTTVFLVGHVTKEGTIAGPKILEHMVDTVLYFEGERGNSYRILRAVKNRYGPSDELGIFEMHQCGLLAVSNPSTLFLTQREEALPGTAIFPNIEGSRPLLVEIQALVSKSYFPAPKRTVVGWDINRLFTMLAVIESKCKISFSDQDVYLNIAGGLKIADPAGDLAAAISMLSARNSTTLGNDVCAFGEIGLTGEIRSVSRCAERVKEAEKLGFSAIILPFANKYIGYLSANIRIIEVKSMLEVVQLLKELGKKS